MIDEKHKGLINKLIEKTQTKKANWHKTSGNDEYKIALEKAVITVDRWDEGGYEYVDFRILNDRGDTISVIYFNQNDDRDDFYLLSSLHTLAKESYYKVDETIDDIFEELEEDKVIGKEEDDDKLDLPF